MLERGYLWKAQWRAGPHTLFEQYLGFLVLSPAYKNKEKKICETKSRKKILAHLAGITWKNTGHPSVDSPCSDASLLQLV